MENNNSYNFKYLKQVLIVAFEFGVVAFLFLLITNKFVACENVIETIERLFLGVAIYEFTIFITLTFVNDALKDSYIALYSLYKLTDLYFETNDANLLLKIKGMLDKQINDSKIFNTKDTYDEYKELRIILENNDAKSLKYNIIMLEHKMEYINLNWRYTFLLRLFK